MALEEASQMIFLVDGRTEFTSADRGLAQILRKLGKPVVVAVNKIDDPKREALTSDSYSLGFQRVMPISAEHRRGIHELLDELTREFPVTELEEDEERGGGSTAGAGGDHRAAECRQIDTAERDGRGRAGDRDADRGHDARFGG